jgi:hypothetical protein
VQGGLPVTCTLRTAGSATVNGCKQAR